MQAAPSASKDDGAAGMIEIGDHRMEFMSVYVGDHTAIIEIVLILMS